MSEFKVIETQEQFDAMIKDRIEQAKRVTAEQFSDYEQIKEAKEKADQTIQELNDKLAKQKELIDGNDAVVSDLKAKVQKYELDSVKTSIALEKGLPYQMASRLSGTTKDEITADADAMVQLIGSATKQTVPLKTNEPSGDQSKTSAWSQLANSINQGD